MGKVTRCPLAKRARLLRKLQNPFELRREAFELRAHRSQNRGGAVVGAPPSRAAQATHYPTLLQPTLQVHVSATLPVRQASRGSLH